MARFFKSLALALLGGALFATGSMAQAGAQTNQAVLNVVADVTDSCEVLTSPKALLMSYDPIQDLAALGTSSFTYACTSGAAVSVTPTSPNLAPPVFPQGWEATKGSSSSSSSSSSANVLLYTLWNDTTCSDASSSSSSSSSQLSNGVTEKLGPGAGKAQTYNICAIPTAGFPNRTAPAGKYLDTVTFTFNFGP